MSLSNDWELSALQSWFGNVAISGACAALGAAVLIYATLHNAAGGPGETGKQNGNEMSYTGNGGRLGMLQSNGTNYTFQNTNPTDVRNGLAYTFGASSSVTPETLRAFSWGVGASGATVFSFTGDLTTYLTVNQLVQPTTPQGGFIGTMD